MGPMRRVCVSLTSAIKDFHKVAAFIGRAVQWVWGEFRHRAAGFDAQQSVSTLLRQATRLWCIYVKCGKVAKCLDQLKIKKTAQSATGGAILAYNTYITTFFVWQRTHKTINKIQSANDSYSDGAHLSIELKRKDHSCVVQAVN